MHIGLLCDGRLSIGSELCSRINYNVHSNVKSCSMISGQILYEAIYKVLLEM